MIEKLFPNALSDVPGLFRFVDELKSEYDRIMSENNHDNNDTDSE